MIRNKCLDDRQRVSNCYLIIAFKSLINDYKPSSVSLRNKRLRRFNIRLLTRGSELV